MSIDRSATIKQIQKAFGIADYSPRFVYRTLMTSANQLIDHGYRRAKFKNKYGKDFHFDRTDKYVEQTTYVNSEIYRMVSEQLDFVETCSLKIAKDQIAKVPKDKWDKEAFLAAVLFNFTFKQRVKEHTKKFKEEVEAYVRVGQEEGMNGDKVVQWFMDNIKDPMKDELVIAAITAGWINEMKGMSSYRSMSYLADDTITRGFHAANRHYWIYATSKQIIAQRDAHTCSACSDLDGKIFPIEEEVLPVHGSCRCMEIPIV